MGVEVAAVSVTALNDGCVASDTVEEEPVPAQPAAPTAQGPYPALSTPPAPSMALSTPPAPSMAPVDIPGPDWGRRRLTQAEAQAPNASASASASTPFNASTPPPLLRAQTSVTVSVSVPPGGQPSAESVAASLRRLTMTPVGRKEFTQALRSAGQRSAGAVSLAPSAQVAITDAPSPPSPEPADPLGRKLGARLLPLRVVVAVVVAVPLCCSPLLLLGVASWRAAQFSSCVVGVRGRLREGATRQEQSAAALKLRQRVAAFAHAQLRAPSCVSLHIRMLCAQEAALHSEVLWPQEQAEAEAEAEEAAADAESRTLFLTKRSLSAVGEEEEKEGGGSLTASREEVQALFQLSASFRWPSTAQAWRRAVDAGVVTEDLRLELATPTPTQEGSPDDSDADAPEQLFVASPRVLVVLLRHRKAPPCKEMLPEERDDRELYGGAATHMRRLTRRRTLYAEEERLPHSSPL